MQRNVERLESLDAALSARIHLHGRVYTAPSRRFTAEAADMDCSDFPSIDPIVTPPLYTACIYASLSVISLRRIGSRRGPT